MRYSEITPRDPLANPDFRRWFGRSKVVDAHGNPLVLYHGTGDDIRSFKAMVWGSVTPRLASEYAAMRDQRGGAANVMPIYMRVEHPFDADLGLSKTVTVGSFINTMMEQGVEQNGVAITDALRHQANDLITGLRACARREESGPYYDRHDFWNQPADLFGSDGAHAIQLLFRIFGFDGVRMIENNELTYGAFSSAQVKSAIGNRGSFDPSKSAVDETAESKQNENSPEA